MVADGTRPGRGDVRVRAMLEADLAPVREVETEAFDDPWTIVSWEAELARDDRRWRVLCLDAGSPDREVVVGYGGLWLAPDEAHVLRIAVDATWRRRGLGARLLDDLVDAALAAGREALTLEVRASDDAAMRLYRRRGFVPCGVRPRYYADGEDAAVLWRGPRHGHDDAPRR